MSDKSYIAIALAAAVLGAVAGSASARDAGRGGGGGGGGGHFAGGFGGGHFGGGFGGANFGGSHIGGPAGGGLGGHLPTEAFPGPTHYHGVTPPAGWNDRPALMDRGAYQHDYQAARAYKIGPYHPPRANWHHRHHVYGDFLPADFWASDYLIDDYWLFSLETPPAGCEWVRYGDDAMLIDTSTGEIIQAVYDVFD